MNKKFFQTLTHFTIFLWGVIIISTEKADAATYMSCSNCTCTQVRGAKTGNIYNTDCYYTFQLPDTEKKDGNITIYVTSPQQQSQLFPNLLDCLDDLRKKNCSFSGQIVQKKGRSN
ncbi:hypothetical protein Bealeia1_00834 [Candidatus Bealeia paramacronuclearis]|uniref:Secreted protein n=1 Tax=Candidatus Bealeia paramacronuclearis TaxID=1921001 RepID=A0ABZ2C2R7_9PROT|nr:hypothetical protein [Candidatus Bealeia paramacronuclearis]